MVVELVLLALSAYATNPCLEVIKGDVMTLGETLSGKAKDYSPLIRFWYTGKEINDLGHYQSCEDREDSEYFLLKFKGGDYPKVMGVCAPKGCTPEDFSSLFDRSEGNVRRLGTEETQVVAEYPVTYELENGGWLFVLVLVGLTSLAVVGTFASIGSLKAISDSSMQLREFTSSEAIEAPLFSESRESVPEPQSLAAMVLSAFSLVTSFQQLKKNNSSSSILSLNGVRVMAIGWVILGQLYITRVHGITVDLEDLDDVAAETSTAFGYASTIGVNTLFWLTGFFAGLGILNALESTGKINWKLALLLRVFRLLPVLVFCLAFNNYILPSLGFGPMWSDIGTDFLDDCSAYWWTNLLALNNIVPDGLGNLCYFSSWAVAVNLQLFALAPLLVILYLHKPKAFIGLVAGLTIASLATTAGVAGGLSLDVNYLSSDRLLEQALYNKPFFHFLPFFFGLYLSLVFYMYKQGETNSDPVARFLLGRFAKSTTSAWICFLIGFGYLNVSMFGTGYFYVGETSRAANVWYLTLAQLIDALNLSAILLPVLLQELPKVAAVLSLPIWGPMARLSFCAYMMHEGVIRAVIKGEQTGYFWGHISLFNDFVFNLVLSYLAAVPVFFLVEGPTYTLTSKITSKPVRAK